MKIMKKVIFVILLIAIIFTIFSIFPNNTYASTGWTQQARNFLDRGRGSIKISDPDLQEFIRPIGNLLMVIAVIVLVIVSIVMGIKYIAAASNPEEQAKLKKQLIGLVISAVVIFGAQLIWSLTYNLFKDI